MTPRSQAAAAMATVEGIAASVGVALPPISLDEVMEHLNRPRCPFCGDHGPRPIPDEGGGGWEWMCGSFQTNDPPKPHQMTLCMRLAACQRMQDFLEQHEGEAVADDALAILGNLREYSTW